MDTKLKDKLISKIERHYQRFYTDEDESKAEIGFATKEALTNEQMAELSDGIQVEMRLLGYTIFLDDINYHVYKDRKWKDLLNHH